MLISHNKELTRRNVVEFNPSSFQTQKYCVKKKTHIWNFYILVCGKMKMKRKQFIIVMENLQKYAT